MNLLKTMDALLRDPESVYRMAAEGRDLGRLCAKLLLIFVITAGLCGAAMGSFRWLHPGFFFSDFELSSPEGPVASGQVAGVNYDTNTIYATGALPDVAEDATIRFNLTQPSDPYKVQYVTREKGYTAIVLAPGSSLGEPDAWKLPLLVAAKTPLLFILTLGICSLALYVLNLAFDIRLHFMPVMTTMSFGLAATGVMLGVLVPITGMFSVVTGDYHFMKVLHLLAFTLAGLYGVKILYRGLVRLAPEGSRGVGKLVFVYLVLYCIIGSQVAWTLKPYLGTPYLPATPPFRVEAGNIYVSVFSSAARVASPALTRPSPPMLPPPSGSSASGQIMSPMPPANPPGMPPGAQQQSGARR